MMVVVSDTGPLLHLNEAGALELLSKIASVSIPGMVESELSRYATISIPPWLHISPLSQPSISKSIAWQEAGLVDEGEAFALALALELKCDWFLTDDAAARLLGESMGLEVLGSLGIVLFAAAKGLTTIQEAHQILIALKNSSLWLSPKVFHAAEMALDEIQNSK